MLLLLDTPGSVDDAEHIQKGKMPDVLQEECVYECVYAHSYTYTYSYTYYICVIHIMYIFIKQSYFKNINMYIHEYVCSCIFIFIFQEECVYECMYAIRMSIYLICSQTHMWNFKNKIEDHRGTEGKIKRQI